MNGNNLKSAQPFSAILNRMTCVVFCVCVFSVVRVYFAVRTNACIYFGYRNVIFIFEFPLSIWASDLFRWKDPRLISLLLTLFPSMCKCRRQAKCIRVSALCLYVYGKRGRGREKRPIYIHLFRPYWFSCCCCWFRQSFRRFFKYTLECLFS